MWKITATSYACYGNWMVLPLLKDGPLSDNLFTTILQILPRYNCAKYKQEEKEKVIKKVSIFKQINVLRLSIMDWRLS